MYFEQIVLKIDKIILTCPEIDHLKLTYIMQSVSHFIYMSVDN